MTDNTATVINPHLTDEQREALIAADPDAFDVEDKAAGTDTDADLSAAPKVPDAEPAETSTEAEPAGTADAQRTGMIPKARLDEVIIERNTIRERLQALEAAEQARMEAEARASERNFADELATIEGAYDEGDLTRAEYMEKRDEIIAAQAKATYAAEQEQREAARAEREAEERWKADSSKFFAAPENVTYTSDKIRAGALNIALQEVFAEKGGQIGYFDALVAARDRVDASFGKPAASPSAPSSPHAERNARDAAAASSAASGAPQLSGGVGGRGTDLGPVDLSNVKPGSFSKSLSKADQEKLLGEGAV